MRALMSRGANAWRALALAALVPAWPVSGQTAPANTLECTQVALAEQVDAAPAPRRDIRREPVARDDACWLDLGAARAWGGARPTWVDVRSVTETRGVRIAGALQIPLADVAGKAFLKAAPIVLVGTGFDDADLQRACGELKRAGFAQGRLLRGGIRAWEAAGEPLAVTGPAQALDVMSAGEFHRHAGGAPWLVVGIDVRASDEVPPLLAQMRRVDAEASASRVVAAVAQARADIARMPAAARPDTIVIVARDDATSMRWREALRREHARDVLFLGGGLAGYQQYLREQQSIAANAGKPLTRPCGSG